MELKTLLYISTLFLLTTTGCIESGLTAIEKEFYNKRIHSEQSNLYEKVMMTGYSPGGKELIEIAKIYTEKTSSLIESIQKNENISKNDIEDLIHSLNNSYLSIPIDSNYLFRAYNLYHQGNDKSILMRILLTHNLTILQDIRIKHEDFYIDVDYLNPTVISNEFEIGKGKIFSGKVTSKAELMQLITYEIDDPQTTEGFIKLEQNSKSGYDGIIQIKGKELGEHTIKIRSIYNRANTIDTIESEFKIKVK